MARFTGLQFVIITAILQVQACNAAVIRRLETTTISLETTPQVSTIAHSTIPQDIIAQTTLPPILFRASTITDTATSIGATADDTSIGTTADNTSIGTTADDTSITTTADDTSITTTADDTSITTTADDTDSTEPDNQTTPEVQPELPGQLLSRGEPELGRESSLAYTSTVDSDSSLVPTTQLVPINQPVPEMGKSAMVQLVKTTQPQAIRTENTVPRLVPPKVNVPTKEKQSIFTRIETVTVSKSSVKTERKGVPLLESMSIPRKVHDTRPSLVPEPVSIPREDTRPSLVPEPVSIPREVQDIRPDLVPEPATIPNSVHGTEALSEKVHSGSFVPTAVQVMAYAIQALWEKEHKKLDGGYKVTEDVNDTKNDWEDDDMSKPRFQTNVPIVNSESVPMRMHMDIIPQGFPEDLEESILYPDYYDDKDTRNDLGKYTDDPLDKDDGFDDPEEVEDVEGHVDRFGTMQQHMKLFRRSETFDRLVDLHRDLAVYAKNHDIKMYKGFSGRVTDVLQKSADNVASQLKCVISMISDEIDDEPLDNHLRNFQKKLSESNSESSLALSSLPALQYS